MTSLTRENFMAAYQTAVGAGEKPKYVIVGSMLDEMQVREVIVEMQIGLRTAYDSHLLPGDWLMV